MSRQINHFVLCDPESREVGGRRPLIDRDPDPGAACNRYRWNQKARCPRTA